MAVVAKLGKPDLFVTFTCNPDWPEIRAELLGRQSPADRPDLCARVFHMKVRVGAAPGLRHWPSALALPLTRAPCSKTAGLQLGALCDMLFKDHVLGKPVARCHVIEFQKRGLPHAHMLIILDADDRPSGAADIDRMVCAELPGEPLQRRRWPMSAVVCGCRLSGAMRPCPQIPSLTTPPSALCARPSPR